VVRDRVGEGAVGQSLTGRCLVLGERAVVEEVESWIDWAARSGLNSIFIHTSLSANPTGAAPERVWRDNREGAIASASERGIAIEHGGHLLPELFSRADARALAADAELSNAGREALTEHVRAHPEAEVLHIWGADAPAGAGGREASEAALRTANALAEIAEEVRPGAVVAFLAYHDTEEVPAGVEPRPNVSLVFAPRERCYDHALADPNCQKNARHRELLEGQLQHFADAAPPRVFEYWCDAILFSGGVPDLSETIARDIAYYRDVGVHTVQLLITGHGESPEPHPNLEAFARAAVGADSVSR
jgi:hypothetical protein